MPAFVEKYSTAQREALFRAVIDQQIGVRASLRACAAGELPGLAPVDQKTLAGMAYGYACELVREERENRAGVQVARTAPDRIAQEIATRVLKRAQRDLIEIERKAGKRAMKADESAATDAAVKRARAAMALLRELGGLARGSGKPSTPAAARSTSLAERIAGAQTTAQADHHTQEDIASASALATTEADDTLTNRSDAGSVRSSSFEIRPV